MVKQENGYFRTALTSSVTSESQHCRVGRKRKYTYKIIISISASLYKFPLILSMLNMVYNAPGSLWITFCLFAPILELLFSCGLRLSAKAAFDYTLYFPPTEGLLCFIRFSHSMLTMIEICLKPQCVSVN